MRWTPIVLLGLVLLTPESTHGAPDREAALFGAPESADSKGEERPSSTVTATKSNTPEMRLESDPLQIGGRLYLRMQTMAEDSQTIDELPLDHSAMLYLYGDARPTSRVRAFVKSRVDHRFTQPTGLSLIASEDSGATTVTLDQLWLKFDIARAVFVTIGQQPVRWGTTRIWNPVDFVNAQRKNPLAIFDARPGIPLLKLHMPIEGLGDGANLYAIAQLDDVSTVTDVGGLLRAEVTTGPTETGLSFAARHGQPLRLGVDFSGGVGPLDVRFEGAASRGGEQRSWEGPLVIDPQAPMYPQKVDREDEWIPKGTAGIEWGIPYGDDDTLYLTLEYFFNDAGYSDDAIYPWLITQGDFAPLYLGRHYLGAGVAIPRPGGWNDTTLMMTGISNLSDGTHIARLDYQVRILTRLSVYCFLATHLGESGEFRFALDVPAIPGVPELEEGLSIKPTRLHAGAWLSVDL
jgi:hypothetical protein